MTKFYFEKLGTHYTGSVVPLCAPQNPHLPGPKSLAYSGAIQDLQYVLGLIGEDPQGEIINLVFNRIFYQLWVETIFTNLYQSWIETIVIKSFFKIAQS